MALSITPCFIQDQKFIRRYLKSFLSCTFIWETRCWIMPQIDNWIEVTAVRRPQIWRDKYMATGFIHFLHLASLKTLQPKFGRMIVTTEDWEWPVSLAIWCVAGLVGWLSAHASQPHFLKCVFVHFGHQLLCLRSVFRISDILLSNVLSLPSSIFYPEIEPVVCINVLL